MNLGRAHEINARMCNAYLVLSGIMKPPVPSLAGFSVAEAIEAGRIVANANSSAKYVNGRMTITTVVDEDIVPQVYARAVLAIQGGVGG